MAKLTLAQVKEQFPNGKKVRDAQGKEFTLSSYSVWLHQHSSSKSYTEIEGTKAAEPKKAAAKPAPKPTPEPVAEQPKATPAPKEEVKVEPKTESDAKESDTSNQKG